MNNDIFLLETLEKLLNEGYDIEDILNICNSCMHNSKIDDLYILLNNGISFSDALLEIKFNKLFKEYFKFFITRGNISEAIHESLKIMKIRQNLFDRLSKKLSYPVILLIFLLFFSIFVVTTIIPTVESLFKSFEIKKTLIVNILFIVFRILPFFMIISTLALIILVIYAYISIKKKRYENINGLINHSKIISKIIRKYYSLKFALYYNELYKSGYDTTEIIDILNQQVIDSDVKMIIYEIYLQIQEGNDIVTTVEQFNYFEDIFKNCFMIMMKLNNTTSVIDDYISLTLLNIDQTITKVLNIMIPFIYVFVGSFVIMIYISIIIPMMNVVNEL